MNWHRHEHMMTQWKTLASPGYVLLLASQERTSDGKAPLYQVVWKDGQFQAWARLPESPDPAVAYEYRVLARHDDEQTCAQVCDERRNNSSTIPVPEA